MAEDNDTIGKQIGNYRISNELGSGGFADVYLAHHLIFADEPPVAIKLLYTRLKQKERESFIQEAQFLRRLRHPHILPVLDAGFHEGTPYIVMEYAAKGSLQDSIEQRGDKPFPLDEAVAILTAIGEALSYAHQQNIVHRDLKPDNILFNAKGEALLADFGLATILSSARTLNIGSAGTPAYMAPEMFNNIVSVKSDQYALGCVAYELFTGQKPYDLEGAPVYVAQYQHAKVEPVAPSQHNAQLPAHVSQAILTAIAKDRNQRHADISTFLKALSAPQKSAQEWFNEGRALFYVSRRYEEALLAYDHAIRLNPNDAEAYYNKGKVFYDLKRYEEALLAYDHAIRLNPNDADAYYYEGIALYDLQRYEEALLAFEHAVRLDPSYAWAYSSKGDALYSLQRYEEALVTFEHAIRLDPNDVMAYINKGDALIKLQRYEEALIAIDNAILLNPNYAPAYYSKGRTLNKLGRTWEAQPAFDKARALGYNA